MTLFARPRGCLLPNSETNTALYEVKPFLIQRSLEVCPLETFWRRVIIAEVVISYQVSDHMSGALSQC